MTLASGELRNHGRGVSGAKPLTLRSCAGRRGKPSCARRRFSGDRWPGQLGGRKVRAPQGTVPGNARWRKRRGQCNRKQTAVVSPVPASAGMEHEGKGERVE